MEVVRAIVRSMHLRNEDDPEWMVVVYAYLGEVKVLRYLKVQCVHVVLEILL